jgi:hypothetical protein
MRVLLLHLLAKVLRVQFKIGGIPYGANPTNCAPAYSATPHKSSQTQTIPV